MSNKQTNTHNKPTSSSKRRLEFQDGGRTLKNKTFFLDLPDCKNIDQLERELTSRGGKIEKFFHRDVKYLITNRSRDDSNSSPNTPGSTKSHKSPLESTPSSNKSHKSPLESVSSVEPGSKNPVYLTRAARMVAEAKQKSGSKKTVDVIAKAKSWGCKVITLDALLAELKRLKPISKEGKSRSTSGRVHTLTPPYLKVEDQSRGYRPLVYEPTLWQRPSYDTPINGCPFDIPVKKSDRKPSSPDKTTHHHMVTRQKKPGYCECCSQRYDDLHIHLRSTKHQEYANDVSNFTNLDKLIDAGTSFTDFVRALRDKHQSKTKSPVQEMSCDHPLTPSTRSSSPHPLCLSPLKAITLVKGAFTSPLTGRLRITPLKPDVGHVTPLIGCRKRHRTTEDDSATKKHCAYEDTNFVPETPARVHTRVHKSKLANLRTLIARKGVSPTHLHETPSRLVVSLDLQHLATPTYVLNHTPQILLHRYDQKQSPRLHTKTIDSNGLEEVLPGYAISNTNSQFVDSVPSASFESQRWTKNSVFSKRKTSSKRH